MSENKSEEQVLFPEVEVDGIQIKPWSFGILFDISSLVEEVINRAEEKNIDLNFGEFVPYATIAKLFTLASEPLLKIIIATTGEEEARIKGLSLENGIKMLAIIYEQNSGQLKNGLAALLPEETEEESGAEVDKKNEEKEKKES